MNILCILLALGIIGHAINMYCDRILSIFPNGTLKLVNYSKLKEGDYAAKLMEGVSPSVPMRSGCWACLPSCWSSADTRHWRRMRTRKPRCTAQFCSRARRSRASSAPRIT